MSKDKLQEVYNIVNAKWLDIQANGRKANQGRVTETTMQLIKIIHEAVEGGKSSSWSAYSIEIRSKYGVACSQSGIMRIVETIEKVFDIKVTKFKPRAKPKAKLLDCDLSFNRQLNAIFGGVKCSLT